MINDHVEQIKTNYLKKNNQVFFFEFIPNESIFIAHIFFTLLQFVCILTYFLLHISTSLFPTKSLGQKQHF